MRSSVKFVIRHPQYDFELDDLSDVIAENFLEKICKVGNQLLSSYSISTARQYVKGLKVYVEYHRQNLSSPSPITTILSAGIIVTDNKGEWLSDLVAFSDYLSRNYKDSPNKQHRSAMNWWFDNLSSQLICPARLKLKIKKVPVRTGVKNIFNFELTNEAKATIQAFEENAENIDSLTKEATLLYKHICVELKEVNGESLSIHEVPLKAQVVLQKRLGNLRGELQKIFDNAREKRLEGLKMVRRGRTKALPLLTDWMGWKKGIGTGACNPWANHVSELSNDDFLEGLLAWCIYEHELKGLNPKYGITETRLYNLIRKELKYRDIRLEAKEYQEYIGASHDLLVSGYLMLIYDLVANPNAISELSVNADYRRIANISGVEWEKPRANKILTLNDKLGMNNHTKPSKVVATIRMATRHYRKHCLPADRRNLFLINYQNKAHAKGRDTGEPVNNPSGTWFNDHSKTLIERCTSGVWTGTALSIRASLILLEGLKSGVSSAQAKTQHSDSRTTTGYLNKLPMRLQNEEKIRAFMEWLEALVAIDIDDFAAKVGLEPEEFERRRESILSSHFGGLHCTDNLKGFQPGSTPGKPCTQIHRCLTCEKRRNLFVASESNVQHLLLWNDALRYARDNELIDVTADWLLWAAFIDSMLERLQKSSKHRAVLAGARQTVQDMDYNPYLFVFKQVSTA